MTTSEAMAFANTYLIQAAYFLIAVVAVWMISGWVSRMVERGLSKSRLDNNLVSFLRKMTFWGIFVVGFMSCLGMVGIQTAGFAAVFAATGFAVGMALQGTLGNFAAGVMLLLFRPFKTGDVVTVSGVTGKVAEIDIFSTSLDTPDNRRFNIPNGAVFGGQIEIISFHDTRRVEVQVGTDYSQDIDTTRKVLHACIASVDNVLETPESAVVLTELGASSVNWAVRVWVKSEHFWSVKDDLTRSVKYALDKENIGIPFPQMELHLKDAGRIQETTLQ